MAKEKKKERKLLYLQDTHSLVEEKQSHEEKREYEDENSQQDPTRTKAKRAKVRRA